MNILKYLFYPNWKTIHVAESQYEVWNEFKNVKIGNIKNRISICELQYSEIRNKYKIIFKGYLPNAKFESYAYLKCLKKQVELENINYEK